MEDNKKDEEMKNEGTNGSGAGENATQVLPQAVEVAGRDGENESEEEAKGSKLTVLERSFSKKQVCMAGIGLLCAVAVVGCGIWAYGSSGSGNAGAAENVTVSQDATETDDVETTYVLDLGAKADGWDAETSSPVIAHIESDDGSIDFYHAYDANEDESVAVGEKGTYKVTFISPVNADGSIYKVGEESKVEAKAEDGKAQSDKDGEKNLSFTFEKVDADKVTKDELTNLAKDVAEAVKKGDETLTGENATSIVSKVEQNIKKNPNADAEAVEKETEAAQETAKKEESSAKTPENTDGSASKSDDGSSNKGSVSTSKTESKGNTGSTSSGNSSSGTSKKEESAHQHNWVAQTKTVHHDAVTHIVNHAAEYKTVHHDAVTTTVHICNGCGADITGNESAHLKASAMSDGDCESWHTDSRVVTAAYDEQVLVKDAWTETVVDSAAYDETVTTGYVCSSCGATK
jgi:hypothetical protein